MAPGAREEIKVGKHAIRFLVEGEQSAGSVAVFEFDVPAGARVAGFCEASNGLEPLTLLTISAQTVAASIR
jgi:hypothetical protein